MNRLFLVLITLLTALQLRAQTKILGGNITSETKSIFFDDQLFICYKVYDAEKESTTKKINKTGMMTYLDLPLDVKGASVAGDLFETRLACIVDGKQKWTKTLGKTNTSWAPAMAQDTEGFIYAGEKKVSSGFITLYKFDQNGKELWNTSIDSLQMVHQIFVDHSDKLTVLASFTSIGEVEENGSTRYKSSFVYNTLTLNKKSGKLISKIYNAGPTHFCGEGFSKPTLETDRVNYFYKGCSLICSRNDTLSMLIVSEKPLKDLEVVAFTNSDSEFYVLAKGTSGDFKLLIDRWEKGNTLVKKLDLNMSSKSKVLSLIKQKSGGVTIVYAYKGALFATQVDDALESVETTTVVSKIGDFVFSEAIVDTNHSIHLILAKQDSKSRAIYWLKKQL